jgi:DNA helicase-2/ATP-dependent DNA helicase PcrA
MNLTDEQQQIVNAPLGASLVTAGAGSGKTRVLTERIAYLIESAGLRSYEILALTFTNKAAKEMRERVEKMIGAQVETFLGTFHSFCARFLYKNIDKLEGYTKDFSIYDTGDTQKAIKEVLANNTFLDLKKDDVRRIEFKISEIKNENGRAEDFCDGEMLRAVTAYNAFLRKNNALDFDDLLIKTLEVFENHPEILAALQGRFRYILVDEFQDTNRVQYEIVKGLAGVHKNLMVVGDEDQCIYTWRGASIDNFKRFQKDFSPALYKLEQNFRSCKNIVELAGGLVEKNQSHIQKHLFSELPNGNIEFQDFFGARDEARYVVGLILKQIGYGGARPSDFAIMIRINALSRLFEEQLRDYNVPYVVWGGFKFYERAEVKVVLNYLRVLLNPTDDVALFEIINFPRRGIGDTSIDKIKELGKGFDVIRDIEKYAGHFSKKTLAGIKSFRGVYDRLAAIHNDFGFLALSEHLIGEIGLDREYERSKDLQDRERLENVYQLVLDIKEAVKNDPELTLSMYLKRATLATDSDSPEIEDRVVITTVHSAKGLEFKNVFIVGLEDGLFPISRAFNSAAEMEEERRLLYVAITRAKQGLHLSFCQRRMMWGKEENICVPSRFLKEMGFHCHYEKAQPTWQSRQSHEIFLRNDITAKPDTAESLGFEINDKVRHEKFGVGVVLEVLDKNILKIRFDLVGVKMLSLAYAKVEKYF